MKNVLRIISVSLVCIIVATTTANAAVSASPDDSNQTAQMAVLVTGASSGIGRNITERLASEGYFVYAGARKKKDLEELDAIENVQSIRLDVTIQDEIDAAVETVRGAGRGLYGVVNNAGVVVFGAMNEMDESELDFQFNVNIYGPYRVTKAFSPLLIEQKGRIVNISSIAGVLSGPLFGAYSMSKHAVEAYTDSLEREMASFGVEVSAVEPGNYRSKIGGTALRRMEERGYTAEGSAYQEGMERMKGYMSPEAASQAPEPDDVSAAVVHALFAENPKPHYMVVPTQRQAEFTIRKIIEELVEMNRDHQFSYDRDELVGMLDEALSADSD